MKDYTKLSPDEKDALVKKAMDVGFQTETDYGNCIQSCLNGLYEAFPDLGITKDMLKASFGIAAAAAALCLEPVGRSTPPPGRSASVAADPLTT